MDILTHPLLVLMVGAVLTGLLIPWITRHRQHYQKELELKSELVSEISEAVMKAVMIVAIAHEMHDTIPGNPEEDGETIQAKLDSAYRDWLVGSCIIGSKIHAYYPDKSKGDEQIHKKWDRFSKKTTDYFKRMRNLASEAGSVQSDERENLFESKAMLIQEILETKMTGWRTKLLG